MGKGGQSPVERGAPDCSAQAPGLQDWKHTQEHIHPGALRPPPPPRPQLAHTPRWPAPRLLQPGFFPEGADSGKLPAASRGRRARRAEGGPARPLQARRRPPPRPRAAQPARCSHPQTPRSRGARTRQSAHKRPGPLYKKEISLKSEILVPFPS